MVVIFFFILKKCSSTSTEYTDFINSAIFDASIFAYKLASLFTFPVNTKPQSFSIFCKSHWNHAALFSLSFLADSIFCKYLFTISAVARTAIFFGNKTFLA